LVAAVLLPACGPRRPAATFVFAQEFDTLNPLYTNMWFSQITQQLWDCWAWNYDDQSNPVPLLVTEMPSVENGGISADGKVITLHLRDDIVWSDGEPITSDDFRFTYEMTVDARNAVASVYPYDRLTGVETPDERTVVVTFDEPFAGWQGALWRGLLPAHVLRPVFEAEGTLDNAEWNRKPTVGCGPYVFDRWEPNSFARFVANDEYWRGLPKIEEIRIRFVLDDASVIAALKAGQGDLGTFVDFSQIPTLQQAGLDVGEVFVGSNEGLYFYLDAQNGHPALQDVRVRQAIALAIDRTAICRDLLLGLAQPAETDWDNTPWVDPTLAPWPYDPERARTLLDDAGWVDSNGDGVRDRDGVELILTYGTTTREIRRAVQDVVRQQLATVGIQVDVLNAESDLFFAGYDQDGPAATGQYDLFQYSQQPLAFPDPDIPEWLCSEIPSDASPEGTNWQAVCDPELDALFRSQATQVDLAQRQQTFYQITRLIHDKVYWLGLWQDMDTWPIGPRLRNVRLSATTPFYSIIEWELGQ
jgi:peptide/nickel transport system substrate-binding protein